MKFKVGDKVRVIKNLEDIPKGNLGTVDDMYKYANKVATIIEVKEYSYSIDLDEGYWEWGDYMLEELVTDDYITTKDFIKEVGKLGYAACIQNDYIKVLFNTDLVLINKNLVNKFSTAFATLSDEELDLIVKYAKTPIEFREVKEYTLQCPLTGAYLYVESTNSGKPVWLHKNNFITNKKGIPKYTQQEIDNLPNQELIRCLIEKEVEYD